MSAPLRGLLRLFGLLLYSSLLLYGAAALRFCAPESVAAPLALAVVAVFLVTLFLPWRRRLMLGGPVLIVLYAWYGSIAPKKEAQWAKDVAVLPQADVEGDRLTVRGVRNFRYRSDTDFDAEYYDKVYDLSQVRTVDLFLSYWGMRAIAHTIMSFGFSNGDHLAISIEARREAHEEYSAIQGFFKKFELTYVVADECDLVNLRINHRGEDVYLYRLRITPPQARVLLVDYMKSVDRLEATPEFYNALMTNCTTTILPHVRIIGDLSLSWKLLANGYIDEWRYEAGVWGFDVPFDEFRARSRINERGRTDTCPADFSQRIRKDLPSIRKE